VLMQSTLEQLYDTAIQRAVETCELHQVNLFGDLILLSRNFAFVIQTF